MAEKAKEFKRMQKEALSKGLKPSIYVWKFCSLCVLHLDAGFGSSATGISSASTPLTAVQEPTVPRPVTTTHKAGGGKALKLGAKTKDEDIFLQQLRQEGQAIAPVERAQRDNAGVSAAATVPVSNVKREAVHVRTEEKIIATVSRDGGLQGAE
ncbi:hypothetical protein OESDEN_21895, partial [Oesophagostomum dentatum]